MKIKAATEVGLTVENVKLSREVSLEIIHLAVMVLLMTSSLILTGTFTVVHMDNS